MDNVAAKGLVFPERIAIEIPLKDGDGKVIRDEDGEKILVPWHEWRYPAPLEFYVDFETVNSINDNFADVLQQGGQAMIFQIGCGWLDPVYGVWVFEQWTADRLTEKEEERIIEAWLDRMYEIAAEAGTTFDQCRVCHWSPAEISFLDSAYNSARARLGKDGIWPNVPWFDLLLLIARRAPLTVKGAMNFGLKSIAKSMFKHGLIETNWADGVADGLGAMTGAWWCDAEAERLGCSMMDIPLMQEIGDYNGVDVKVMMEILWWLRDNR